MKKKLSMLLLFAMMLTMLVGCGGMAVPGANGNQENESQTNKIAEFEGSYWLATGMTDVGSGEVKFGFYLDGNGKFIEIASYQDGRFEETEARYEGLRKLEDETGSAVAIYEFDVYYNGDETPTSMCFYVEHSGYVSRFMRTENAELVCYHDSVEESVFYANKKVEQPEETQKPEEEQKPTVQIEGVYWYYTETDMIYDYDGTLFAQRKGFYLDGNGNYIEVTAYATEYEDPWIVEHKGTYCNLTSKVVEYGIEYTFDYCFETYGDSASDTMTYVVGWDGRVKKVIEGDYNKTNIYYAPVDKETFYKPLEGVQ